MNTREQHQYGLQAQSKIRVPGKMSFFIIKKTGPGWPCCRNSHEFWLSNQGIWMYPQSKYILYILYIYPDTPNRQKSFQFGVALEWFEGSNLEKDFDTAAGLAASIAPSCRQVHIIKSPPANSGRGRHGSFFYVYLYLYSKDATLEGGRVEYVL